MALPVLTQDILRNYIESAGIEVTSADQSYLGEIVAASRADFVITDREALAPHEINELLEPQANVRVLTVSGDGREATLYELRPTQTPLGGLSRNLLISVITGHQGGARR